MEPTVTSNVIPHPDVAPPEPPDESEPPPLDEPLPPPPTPKLPECCPINFEELLKEMPPAPQPVGIGEFGTVLLGAFALGVVSTGILWWSFSRKCGKAACPA